MSAMLNEHLGSQILATYPCRATGTVETRARYVTTVPVLVLTCAVA